MTDKNTPTAPPPVYQAEFDWKRLLILHLILAAGLALSFPLPWNFILAGVMLAIFGLRYRFFKRPAVILEGDSVTFQPMGHKFSGQIKMANVRGAGSNIVTGGWMTVDLKGFGRRRLTIYPLQDPLVLAATLKAACTHFQSVDRGEA